MVKMARHEVVSYDSTCMENQDDKNYRTAS